MRTHAIIHGDGTQTIRTVPTSADGEPMLLDSAEARIVDLRWGDESPDYILVPNGPAGVDSTSQVTTSDVGSGTLSRKKVDVPTPADFLEGRSYALVSPEGAKQEVIVDHTDATSVYFRDNVRLQFDAGSTLRGIEVTVDFPASEANDEQALLSHVHWNYAVDWVFPDQEPNRARELIFLRRTAEAVLARTTDIELLDHTIGRLNTRDNKVEKALEQAHRDFYRRVRARRIDPDLYLPGKQGRDWVTYRAAEILRRGLGTDRDDEMADQYNRAHRGIWNDLGGFGEAHTNKIDDRQVHDVAEKVNWRLT